MSAILPINLTLFGQQVQGISIPIGSTVIWTLDFEDPFTRAPIDLTVAGTGVQMSLTANDPRGNPILPELFSRSATITGSPINRCTVPWASGDTVPSGSPLPPGSYSVDVWLTDGGGNRLQVLGTAKIQLKAVATLPGTLVSPLPAQVPLGQGVPGLTWRGTWSSTTTYAVNDAVTHPDPTGGGSARSSFRALAPSTNVPPVDGGGVLSSSWAYVAQRGGTAIPSYDTAHLPGATTVPFLLVFNTDLGAPQISNGTDWITLAVEST